MTVNLNDKIGKTGPVQRKKVETRAAELIQEELTLREIRRARRLTQARVVRRSKSPPC